MRDHADVYTLTGARGVTYAATRAALLATAAYRQIAVVPLSTAIGDLIELRAGTYTAYRSGLGPDGHQLPADFELVVRAVIDFADPLVEDRETSRQWNPRGRNWEH